MIYLMPLEKLYKDQSQSPVSESLHWFLCVRRRAFTATFKGSLKELVGDFLRDFTPAFLTILL